VLVEQHAENERERAAAQEFIGGGVLGDGEGRHAGDPAVSPQGNCTGAR
jgi:hypothetical protein